MPLKVTSKKIKTGKLSQSAEDICANLKCDPIAILAMFAIGDVVGLKLMTQKELDDPGEFDKKRKIWIKDPGSVIALHLIDPDQRKSAAEQLAPYFRPKRQPEPKDPGANPGVDPETGQPLNVRVTLYLPENNRDKKKS